MRIEVSVPGIRKERENIARPNLIFDDILSALECRRSPVVITKRKDHLDLLAGRLCPLYLPAALATAMSFSVVFRAEF